MDNKDSLIVIKLAYLELRIKPTMTLQDIIDLRQVFSDSSTLGDLSVTSSRGIDKFIAKNLEQVMDYHIQGKGRSILAKKISTPAIIKHKDSIYAYFKFMPIVPGETFDWDNKFNWRSLDPIILSELI